MRHLSILIISLLFCYSVNAATYIFQNDGDWTDQSNWDVYPGTTTNSSDSVIISADATVNTSLTVDGYILVNESFTFTVDRVITLNGELLNQGTYLSNTQINIFGDFTNHGHIEQIEDRSFIIANNANFYTDGTFINNGNILGFNTAQIDIEGNFTNNESMTINSLVNINLNSTDAFTNNGFCQFNAIMRVEGALILSQTGTININPSSLLILSDNSKLINLGLLEIQGACFLSSQLLSDTVLGNIIVKGSMYVKSTIPEVL